MNRASMPAPSSRSTPARLIFKGSRRPAQPASARARSAVRAAWRTMTVSAISVSPSTGPSSAWSLVDLHGRSRASLEGLLRLEDVHHLDQLGHQPGPSGLVAGPEPGAIVAVEILVEQDMIAPVRIGLE